MTYLTKLKKQLSSLDKSELIELIIASDGVEKLIRNKDIVDKYEDEINNKTIGVPYLVFNLSESYSISERQVYRIISKYCDIRRYTSA